MILKMKYNDTDKDMVELVFRWGGSEKIMAVFHEDCLDKELSEALIDRIEMNVRIEIDD